MRLKDKVAIITGGAHGMGEAEARLFAKEGAAVIIADRRADLGEALAADITASQGRASFVTMDVAQEADWKRLIEKALSDYGRIDILVNNAGIQFVSPVEDFPEEKWDAIIAINMSSNFHAIRAALPGMKQRGWGRIINIASAHGLVASPYKVAYVAAKHGVVGMTKVVALEIAETPITCNAICPGFVRTPLAEAQVKPLADKFGISEEAALRDHLLVKQPSRRWIEVEDIARMALYLCGPGSGAVNGAALSIDGGWLAA